MTKVPISADKKVLSLLTAGAILVPAAQKNVMEEQRVQRRAGSRCLHKELPKSLGFTLQFIEKA